MAEISFELKKKKYCSRIKKALDKCLLTGNIETHYLLVCPEDDKHGCYVKASCFLKLNETETGKINNLRGFIEKDFECSEPILKFKSFGD